MTKTPSTSPKQAKNKKYMLVRCGRMDAIGWFEHDQTSIPKMPTRVVVKTEKGLELGYLVGQLACYKAGQFRLTRDQIQKYFECSDIEFSSEPVGKVIRYATAEDISEEWHLKKIAKEEMERCRFFVEELKLPMDIIDAEHIFGGERVIFYFMADGRIDFRELVKKLAKEYQTRIEMRQIGSRDEAKLLADYETCGQQCCCRRFLKALKPVNMRMAKMQKATLDPSKISGYCGRLKCCLRYEDETYTELKKHLPKRGTSVKTQHGRGRVIDTQILTQLVIVEHETGQRVAVPVDELEIISSPATTKKEQNSIPDNEEQHNRENENKTAEDKEQHS